MHFVYNRHGIREVRVYDYQYTTITPGKAHLLGELASHGSPSSVTGNGTSWPPLICSSSWIAGNNCIDPIPDALPDTVTSSKLKKLTMVGQGQGVTYLNKRDISSPPARTDILDEMHETHGSTLH
jgi:hypothetical protein